MLWQGWRCPHSCPLWCPAPSPPSTLSVRPTQSATSQRRSDLPHDLSMVYIFQGSGRVRLSTQTQHSWVRYPHQVCFDFEAEAISITTIWLILLSCEWVLYQHCCESTYDGLVSHPGVSVYMYFKLLCSGTILEIVINTDVIATYIIKNKLCSFNWKYLKIWFGSFDSD